MSHKRNEALRHVQHSMHHVIAAGEGSDRAPDSCKLCPYYRPDFKFRTCLYAHCPYKKQVNVFRSTPEKWDILYIDFLYAAARHRAEFLHLIGDETAHGWRRRCTHRYHSGAPAERSVRLIFSGRRLPPLHITCKQLSAPPWQTDSLLQRKLIAKRIFTVT